MLTIERRRKFRGGVKRRETEREQKWESKVQFGESRGGNCADTVGELLLVLSQSPSTQLSSHQQK